MDKIIDILRKAESQIREVMAASALAGNYAVVNATMRVAGQLQAMIADNDVSETVEGPEPEFEAAPQPKSSAPRRKTIPARKPAGKTYPRYEVRGTVLTKIGWSKKHGREYQHNAGQQSFDRVVDVIAEFASLSRMLIAAEELFARIPTIPHYQSYLVLGFLCDKGALKRRGRDGYQVPSNFKATAERAWQLAQIEDGA